MYFIGSEYMEFYSLIRRTGKESFWTSMCLTLAAGAPCDAHRATHAGQARVCMVARSGSPDISRGSSTQTMIR